MLNIKSFAFLTALFFCGCEENLHTENSSNETSREVVPDVLELSDSDKKLFRQKLIYQDKYQRSAVPPSILNLMPIVSFANNDIITNHVGFKVRKGGFPAETYTVWHEDVTLADPMATLYEIFLDEGDALEVDSVGFFGKKTDERALGPECIFARYSRRGGNAPIF